MQIQPTEITDYDRSYRELEEFWVFCILVAGKNSDNAARVTGRLCAKCPDDVSLLKWLTENYTLHNALVAARTGQYTRYERAITESVNLDLANCSLDDLLSIHGVGPKTARLFLVHSRPNQKYAILDTHILRWLREHDVDTPQQTPQGEQYNRLERVYLSLIRVHYPNLPIAKVDLLIWLKMSNRLQEEL